jgi:hypothetical protein
MTVQELITELAKMPQDYEIDVVLDFNQYPDGADSEMDLEEIIGAGTPCTLFLEEETKRVAIITLPTPGMEDVWDCARNISLKLN